MPEPGSVVARLSTPRGEIVVRYPQPGDAPALLTFINALAAERTFVLIQGQQLTLDQEEHWLRERLAGIAAGNEVYLAAFAGDTVAGGSGISLKPLVEDHVGVFGISITAGFRGLGLGRSLMEIIIDEAITHLPGLRIIELSVFANNTVARTLYSKLGFIEFGALPQGIRHRGELVDHIHMYRNVLP